MTLDRFSGVRTSRGRAVGKSEAAAFTFCNFGKAPFLGADDVNGNDLEEEFLRDELSFPFAEPDDLYLNIRVLIRHVQI